MDTTNTDVIHTQGLSKSFKGACLAALSDCVCRVERFRRGDPVPRRAALRAASGGGCRPGDLDDFDMVWAGPLLRRDPVRVYGPDLLGICGAADGESHAGHARVGLALVHPHRVGHGHLSVYRHGDGQCRVKHLAETM